MLFRSRTGVGSGVYDFTDFEGVNYLIFREKVQGFSPDHSHIRYFLIDKRSKSVTQQGFQIYSANPNYSPFAPFWKREFAQLSQIQSSQHIDRSHRNLSVHKDYFEVNELIGDLSG